MSIQAGVKGGMVECREHVGVYYGDVKVYADASVEESMTLVVRKR